MFDFTGLKKMHNDMKVNKETRAAFKFEYNKKPFSCIFLSDITPYRLYLTTHGVNPITFEFEIKAGYKTTSYMNSEDYFELLNYLELEYDPNNKFSPLIFFDVLNKYILNVNYELPKYSDVLKVAEKNRDIEDGEKVYFCGWRKNQSSEKVSEKNLEKTRSAFGDKIARLSKLKNVSSKWTNNKNEESIKNIETLKT
ncbi:DUF6037 family protein [Alkalibacillus haloalkaliphilus]|uniref:DUF6037 family protein n=1 Tax=Alkalibacillus haloalkaliphilus TaxID=94136 RepID=UPI00293666EA|nr:DUF6037 family protein [Alkalibacillus haloalkaliphilus]MDV2581687.1 DUF6037 family protein [Alkalibacillus haloalkaliphilus]